MVKKRIILDVPKTKPSNAIKWNNASILPKHDFRKTIREICKFSNSVNLTKISLTGGKNSGKSTMSMSLAHAIHVSMLKEHNISFKVRIINEHDLPNLQKIWANLTPANYVLIFDDISCLDKTKRGKDIIEEIRRIRETNDTRIIMIYNYIYSKTLNEYLKKQLSIHFECFLTVGYAEEKDIRRILGKESLAMIENFTRSCSPALLPGKRLALSDGKQKFVYKYHDPFIPAIFNGLSPAHIIMSPTRKWQDPDCDICNSAEKEAGTS